MLLKRRKKETKSKLIRQNETYLEAIIQTKGIKQDKKRTHDIVIHQFIGSGHRLVEKNMHIGMLK